MRDLSRVSIGIKELDEGLEGGIPKGNWVVVTGEPGTGKSILCMHYAYTGLRVGDPVIYVTTEAEFRDVIRQSKQFNMDLENFDVYYLGDEKPTKPPQIVVIDIFSLLKTAKQLSTEAEDLERKRKYAALDIETLIAAVNEGYRVLGLTDEKHRSPVKHVRLIIDSISAFWADKPAMARKYSYQLKIATHRENVTALLVSQYAMTTKSVCGDASLVLRVGDSVLRTTISEFFMRYYSKGGITIAGVNIAEVDDEVYVPSLDPTNLTVRWCKVNAVIRHINSDTLYEVCLNNNNKLLLTRDHVLYVVRDGSLINIGPEDLRYDDEIISLNDNLLSELITTSYVKPLLSRVDVVKVPQGVGDGYVYDLSVEPYENYVANGIVVHNSTFGFGLEHIADGIIHLWMDDVEVSKEVRRYLIIKKMRLTNHYRGAYRVEVMPSRGLVLTKIT